MAEETEPTDIQILARFSALKLLGACGLITAAAFFMWTLVPGHNDYQGNRHSPEDAKVMLLSSVAILTAFLPLCAWHIWNFVTRPGALYVFDGRLFIYELYFRSVRVNDIVEVALGRVELLGDTVRLSVTGRRDLKFQTRLMARNGKEVVASIKRIAAIQS